MSARHLTQSVVLTLIALFLGGCWIIHPPRPGPTPTPSVTPTLTAPSDYRPPIASIPTFVETAGRLVPIKQESLIIPESAFKQALAASGYYRVDLTTQRIAIDLTAAANDPATLGVLGQIQMADHPEPFQGDIFIVARDPQLTRDGKRVVVQNYYVAAVELKGLTLWQANAQTFGVDPSKAFNFQVCCGTPTACIPTKTGPVLPSGPLPCDPAIMNCSGPDFGISLVEPAILQARTLPLIGLNIYPDKPPQGPSIPGEPGRFIPPAPGLDTDQLQEYGACVDRTGDILGNICQYVKPTCDPSDPGYEKDPSGNANVDTGSISSSCGGTRPGQSVSIEYRDEPSWCKYALTSAGSPACGGVCETCSQPISPAKLRPPGCDQMTFTDPDSYINACGAPEQKQQHDERSLWAEMGFPLTPQTRCEPTGSLTGSPYNHKEICTTCGMGSDGNPHCGQFVRESPYNPIAADTCEDVPVGGICEPTTGICGEKLPNGNYKQVPCASPQDSGSKPDEPKPKDEPKPPTKQPDKSPASKLGGPSGGKDDDGEPPPSPAPPQPQSQPAPSLPQGGTPPPPLGPTPPPERKPDKADEWTPEWPDAGQFTRDKSNEFGDPVLIGDGSFHIEQTDLSFEGPVRPLQFTRTYNSRSNARGVLGSNWTINWDVRVQPLTLDTAPGWAMPYCAGTDTTTSCLILYDGHGGEQLFTLDPLSQLYMPPAGSTDTIRRLATTVSPTISISGTTSSTPPGFVTATITTPIRSTLDIGWMLRSADGHEMTFNEQGYLVSDRDRFQNGFFIEYEPTPLYSLYNYYCKTAEDKYARKCEALAFLVGGILKPGTDYLGDGISYLVTQGQLAKAYPLPQEPALRAQLAYARAYFLYLLSLGPDLQGVPYGGQWLRPTRVVDDLGRTLEFSYYHAAPIAGSSPITPTFDFTSTPQVELLKSVRGPAGTQLTFTYSRPLTYPYEINEIFLTQVSRTDAPTTTAVLPAADRTIMYQYQWPEGPTPSYNAASYAATVFDRYEAYYKTFAGCNLSMAVCGQEFALPRLAPGNPWALALLEKDAYISNVADNIIRVSHSGLDESETRYLIDPTSLSFDRVTAQRYGSRQATQDSTLLPPDAPDDHWVNLQLPKAAFTYTFAGPGSTGGDLTDGALPKPILDRYRLETKQPTPDIPVTIVATGTLSAANQLPACSYNEMGAWREQLPGFQMTLPYTNSLASEAQPDFSRPLLRSRFTCEQLAIAQLGDPAHNDLLSAPVLVSHTQGLSTTYSVVWKHVLGHRDVVAANTNRICGWTAMTDRDGDVHYYGLNYRGQVLVDAAKERASGQYLFTEQLYNADGLVVQQRRPIQGSQPWSDAAGSTLYTYDEINPTGNKGWNAWLPLFWTRRMNLLRVEERAAGQGVTDDLESPGGGVTTSVGRYQQFRYEPLFNQLKSVQTGSIELKPKLQTPELPFPPGTRPVPRPVVPVPRPVVPLPIPQPVEFVPADAPHWRTDYVFDYQELSLSPTATITSTLEPVLSYLGPWGFSPILTRTITTTTSITGTITTTLYALDYGPIKSWQLPAKFYGADLNGDGVQGFGYGDQPFQRARGVPILAIYQAYSSTVEPQITTFVYAPHGLPAVVIGPDGAEIRREFYSIGLPDGAAAVKYGQQRPPTDQEVSINYRGFLASVETKLYASTYLTSYGPDSAPCDKLAGSYQWLLPASCASPQSELAALGLPTETVQAIISSTVATAPDRWLTTTLSYAEIGLPSYVWENGRTARIVYDADGRERRFTDPIGSTTVQTYTVLGFPVKTTNVDANGKVLEETERQFDDIGQVLYECQALVAGGCAATRPPSDRTVQEYTYWPEGEVHTVTDPEGLITEYGYNERKLLISQISFHPKSPATQPRTVFHNYNADGDLVATYYGSRFPIPGLPRLLERYVYDGLRRTTTYTDTRGYAWQSAYSNRDLLTRYKRDDTPYSITSAAKPSWETRYQYDDYGQLLRQYDNGILTASYTRTLAGLVYAQSAAGLGTSFTTYDLAGRPTWTRDAAGNVTVYTNQDRAYVSTSAVIRDDGQPRLTTATIDRFDPLGLLVDETMYGSGDTQHSAWQRDGAGQVLVETNPEGFITLYKRNLLGRPLLVSEQRNVARDLDISEFRYNARGQISQIIDPANQITEFIYTPFGEVREQNMPGKVHLSYSYDQLGRLQEESTGMAMIEHIYDQRGDPVMDQITANGIEYPLFTRFFDDLGRLTDAVNHNYALSWLAPDDRQVTQAWKYDPLGRVQQESIRVGLGPIRTVTSNWNLAPAGAWQRDLGYASGAAQAQWREGYDLTGRLAWKERLAPGQAPLRTTFDWLGNIYTGRAQDQAGHTSPFREQRTVDAFGLPLSWCYTAIDVSQDGMPFNSQEGAHYCGSQWVPSECARLLLQIDVLRDVMGRIASLQWQFGNPVFSGSQLVPTLHPQPWRGYTYNPLGQLDQTWEQAGTGNVVSTAGLKTHQVTAQDIARLGAGADQWSYTREQAVGGTTAIRNAATNAERWSLPAPRGDGHQLQQVAVDGVTRTLSYDAAGRIQVDGQRGYIYDPVGRLTGVTMNGQLVEGYAYDALDRLVAVFSGNVRQPASSFTYDGDQMLAAFDAGNRAQWDATWGPGLDQLIEWRDLAGGSGDYIPLVDHRNSIIGAWNVQQSRMVTLGEYSPEGRLLLRNPDESVACQEQGTGTVCPNPGRLPFGFASTWRSHASGLVYMRNRWYSPELGQFISQDPAGYVDSYNSYAYVGYDPINGWDPWGLDTKDLANPLENSVLATPKQNGYPFWHGFGMAAKDYVQQAAIEQLKGVLFGPDLYGIATGLWDAYREGGWLNTINVLNPVNKLLEAYHTAQSEAEQALYLPKVGDAAGAARHAEQSGRAYFSVFPAAVELGQFAAGGLQVARKTMGPRGPRTGPQASPGTVTEPQAGPGTVAGPPTESGISTGPQAGPKVVSNSHGPAYKRAGREFKRWSLIDPNVPTYIRRWFEQQLKQKGWGGYWKNPPGFDIGHNIPGLDEPWNFRWENADMNRFRGAKYRR